MCTPCNRAFGPLLILGILASWANSAQGSQFDYEDAPIRYLTAPVDDPVARLKARIERGQSTLQFDPKLGYLPSLLRELNVPASSQTLVFSKTSFQRNRISPQTPRALYFGDDVYVGYVAGGEVLEVSAVDPKLGAVFYTIDQRPTSRLSRQTHDCLQCHDSSSLTGGVPGHIVRSIYPDPAGQPILSAGTFKTTHQSPLKERWGGWYVTGTHGAQRHMGNVTSADRDDAKLDLDAGANLTDVSNRFDASSYLTPHSDIVALVVLEHQTAMQNLITKASYQTRLALHSEAELNTALGRPANERSESTRSRIRSAVEPLVRYMLFVDEAKLTDPIQGTSGFAQEFARRGKRDSKGRSLRDLDLKSRLFKYPCSYLIHSEAFDALPKEAMEQVHARLRQVLSGQDRSKEFHHLSSEDRAAILEILRDTDVDL